eukprot:8978594-Lingulodinium_polyedra.AAC.1
MVFRDLQRHDVGERIAPPERQVPGELRVPAGAPQGGALARRPRTLGEGAPLEAQPLRGQPVRQGGHPGRRRHRRQEAV